MTDCFYCGYEVEIFNGTYRIKDYVTRIVEWEVRHPPCRHRVLSSLEAARQIIQAVDRQGGFAPVTRT